MIAMKKPKLKWVREGADNYEDLHLIPSDQLEDADGDMNYDAAVAWIKIAYDRTRFYNGRGGEGTSKPDSYVAYVRDANSKFRERVVVDGADTIADVGGLFSNERAKAFRSLRAAKAAVMADLAKEKA